MENDDTLMRYLEGELSAEEKEAFEREMAADPALAERVRMHRRAEQALGDREEIRVENALRDVVARLPEPEEVPDEPAPARPDQDGTARSLRFSSRSYLLMAAAVVLLAVVGIVVFQPSTPVSAQELFAQNYAAYDASGEVRAGTTIPKGLLDDAFDAYDAGDYEQALLAFATVLAIDPANARAQFYSGICQLETGRLSDARASFQAVLDQGQNLYLSQAHWYLGLTCLQEEDLDCAHTQLEPLAERSGAYQDKAQAILDDLAKTETKE